MDFEVKIGLDLSEAELSIINEARKREFGSKDDIFPKEGNDEEKCQFLFLKKENGEVIAFGRVDVMPIKNRDETYDVLCLSTVIALPKGVGYGSQLMEKVKEMVAKTGKTMIGFCETKNLLFYKKCGFEIVDPKENQFVFTDSNGVVLLDIYPGEVFYLDGEDKLISKIIESNDKTIKIERKH